MDINRLLKQIEIAHDMLARVEKILAEPTARFGGSGCEAEHDAYLAACAVEETAATALTAADNVHTAAVQARDAAYTAWLNCESP